MKIKDITLIALFTAVISVCAQITIPIQPVPFTGAIVGIFITGAVLEKKTRIYSWSYLSFIRSCWDTGVHWIRIRNIINNRTYGGIPCNISCNDILDSLVYWKVWKGECYISCNLYDNISNSMLCSRNNMAFYFM